MCIKAYQPDTTCIPKPKPNPNPTTKQLAVVSIQLNILVVACPMYATQFIRDNRFLLRSVVIVTLPLFGTGRADSGRPVAAGAGPDRRKPVNAFGIRHCSWGRCCCCCCCCDRCEPPKIRYRNLIDHQVRGKRPFCRGRWRVGQSIFKHCCCCVDALSFRAICILWIILCYCDILIFNISVILYLFAGGYKCRLATFPTRFAHVISILRYCHCFASLKVLCHE